MKILGIDPGKITGYAIVEYPEKKLLAFGFFKPDLVAETFYLTDQIERHRPDYLACEQPYAGININSYGKLQKHLGEIETLFKLYQPEGTIIGTSITRANRLMGLISKPKKNEKCQAIEKIFPGYSELMTDDIASAIAATMVAYEMITGEKLDV